MKKLKECPICHKEFYFLTNHWRDSHQNEMSYDDFIWEYQGRPVCENCGEPIKTGKVAVYHRFCSVPCSWEWKNKHDQNPRKMKDKHCPICDQDFKSIRQHWRDTHSEEVTIEEFAYRLAGYDKTPICPYCNERPLKVDSANFGIAKSCASPECTSKHYSKVLETPREHGRLSQGLNNTLYHTCSDKCGDLYLVTADYHNDKFVKVGVTTKLKKRIGTFYRNGFYVLEVQSSAGNFSELLEIETKFHKFSGFSPVFGSEFDGGTEWYNFSEKDKIIEYLKGEFGIHLELRKVT